MMSREAVWWFFEETLMWFKSEGVTCNLRWPVLTLLWPYFLWLRLKNSSSMTEGFHFTSHQMSQS